MFFISKMTLWFLLNFNNLFTNPVQEFRQADLLSVVNREILKQFLRPESGQLEKLREYQVINHFFLTSVGEVPINDS